MVNVSKLMGLAGEALNAVKKAPMAQKTAMAAIFGAGAMTGALINCDGFEKEESKAATEQVAKKAVTKPKAEAKKEPEFKYVPPKVGENGIVKADTSYYAGTKLPQYIVYSDSLGQTLHQTNLDKNGKLAGFFEVSPNGKNMAEDFKEYNAKGEKVAEQIAFNDGSRSYEYKTGKGLLRQEYDKYDRITHDEIYRTKYLDSDHYDIKEYLDYTYHKDGSYTETDSYDQTSKTYDKNNRVIKKKQYDINDVLEYTVIPKYNKDGDIVKNDTIRNK